MGHGHVIPNPDGSLARCGGPGICSDCAKELAQLERRRTQDYLKVESMGVVKLPLILPTKDRYSTRVGCANCEYIGRVHVEKGTRIDRHPCPECGCTALSKRPGAGL